MNNLLECIKCGGLGYVLEHNPDASYDKEYYYIKCDECDGKGWIEELGTDFYHIPQYPGVTMRE